MCDFPGTLHLQPYFIREGAACSACTASAEDYVFFFLDLGGVGLSPFLFLFLLLYVGHQEAAVMS